MAEAATTSVVTDIETVAVRPVITRTPLELPANEANTEYAQFVLAANGILVTLVSDPVSEKASAALAVAVGAQDDPPGRAGLAHFTEHAVFLGSEKFPQEQAYKQFLSAHGGSSNAATGMETTTFKFEINAEQYPHALDLFAQFFQRPLFTPNAIGREVMAVDAEDAKNRVADGRRSWQVAKDLMVPDHPYTKFSTGNVHTLAGGDAEAHAAELAAAMRAFHRRHYRPRHMALALVGPQPLATLQQLAVEHFAGIRNDDDIDDGADDDTGVVAVSRPAAESTSAEVEVEEAGEVLVPVPGRPSPFPFRQAGLTVRLRPVKDIRDMTVTWALPRSVIPYLAPI